MIQIICFVIDYVRIGNIFGGSLAIYFYEHPLDVPLFNIYLSAIITITFILMLSIYLLFLPLDAYLYGNIV